MGTSLTCRLQWAAFRRQLPDGWPWRSANAVPVAKSRVLKRLRSELGGLVE